jgi:predicted nucleic acid-binding protein
LSGAAFPRHEYSALFDQPKPRGRRQTRASHRAAESRRWCVVGSGAAREFYVQATRPTRPRPLTHEIAAGLVSAWTRFKVQEITLSILTGALEIKAAHGFSYWDSAIIAAARALGCRILYSEDMSHGREVEGITIVNLFR